MKTPKNVIFFTQASNLNLFYHVYAHLRDIITLDKTGFYVAGSRYFKEFSSKYDIEKNKNVYLLKEWDIIRDSYNCKVDYGLLRDYEKKIGDPTLWNVIVGDRRIYFGKKYAYRQDYNPRFSHDEMMAILQVALNRVENFFDEVKPDFIISFICVTIGDYLAALFAKERNIPFLNLRPTKIKNYMFASESLLYPSERLKMVYEDYLINGVNEDIKDQVYKFMNSVNEGNFLYEGAISPSQKPPRSSKGDQGFVRLMNIKKAVELIFKEFRFRFGEERFDNHSFGYIGPAVDNLRRSFRARRVNYALKKRYLGLSGLKSTSYVFFPLHVEPEFALSVLNKVNLNQIESIRLISHSLPVGMKLVVKEHPVAIGKRPISYYRKLLQIPNVVIADPALNSRELLLNSKMLITVIDKTAMFFEAIILKKPVIILGGAPAILSRPGMVVNVRDYFFLGSEICKLLAGYRYHEKDAVAYIAALISESVDVDFFSILLGRSTTYRDTRGIKEEDLLDEFDAQVGKLAEYLVQRYQIYNSMAIEKTLNKRTVFNKPGEEDKVKERQYD